MSAQIPSVKLVLLGMNQKRDRLCYTRGIPTFKENFAGESSVGKSSIVTRYATDTFVEGRDATIGGNFFVHSLATMHLTHPRKHITAAFLTKVCSTEDREIKFEIWDTAGQDRFHSLAPMYYRNALAAVVVFDVTKYVSRLCI